MISFNKLSQEILKHVRAKRSASGMDSHLSLGSGQYTRWESGQVEIKWEDFVLICKKMKVPIDEALLETLLYSGNPFHYDSILDSCVGKTSQDALGKELEVTRYTVNRWMNRKSSPTLIQMLKIFHLGTTRLSIFIERLIVDGKLPSFENYLKYTESTLELIQEMPWISGVLCALMLNEYRSLPEHSHSWIANKLGMPVSVIEETITSLANHELICLNGKHYQGTLNEINPAVLKEKAKALLLFWMNKNIEAVSSCYPSPGRKSLSSYHVLSVDAKTAEAIKKLYIDFTKDISILVNKGMEKPDSIYSLTISMINFDEFGKIQKEN